MVHQCHVVGTPTTPGSVSAPRLAILHFKKEGLLRCFGVPDLDVFEPAALAGDAEFDLGLGHVADAGGLEEADGLAIEDDAHFVANGFHHEGVGLAGFELVSQREAGGVGGEELVDGVLVLDGVLAHLDEVVALGAIAFVHDVDLVEVHLGAAKVAVMGAFELPVVELDIHHGVAIKTDLGFHDGVLGWQLKAVHGGVGFDLWLAIFGWDVLVAGLGAFESTVFEGEGIDHAMPLGVVGAAFEVIGEKEVLLLGDGIGRDLRRIGGDGEGGQQRGNGEGVADVHGGIREQRNSTLEKEFARMRHENAAKDHSLPLIRR